MAWIELAVAMALFLASHRIPAALGVKGRLLAALGPRGYGILFSVASVLNGFTDSFPVFVFARAMTGFGVFCLMVCSQAYIAEMAPAESRGKWQNLVAAVGFSAVPVFPPMA